jgi:cytochrome oxidase Cu insertion factor (SCO1/SenC/PrrC family)
MRLRWPVLFLALLVLAAAGRDAAAQDLLRLSARWRDDRAQPFELESLRGRWTVLTMAYGACRRICSTSLRLMERAQDLADARHLDLNFVVVGLDPSQDTPADWADFRALRKLGRPNWRFLSGDESATRLMARNLGVNYWRYGEHTMHDFKIVLLTPQGELARSIASFDEPPSRLLP